MNTILFRRLLPLIVATVPIAALACGTDDPATTPEPTHPPGEEATATPGNGETPTPGVATPTPGTPTGEVPDPQSAANELVFAVIQVDPQSGLNRVQAGATGAGVSEALFTTPLFEEHDGDDPTTSWLATEWGFNDDLTQLTISVREGVEFQKGWGEMTAEDVAWNLNDVKSDVTPDSISAQAGDHRALFDGAWRVVDDYTIEVDVIIPDPRMFAYNMGLFFQGPPIFSKAHYDEHGADAARDNVVATGAYEIVEWLRDDRMVRRLRDDGHWRVNPEVEMLTNVATPEGSSRVAMLQTGQVDAADIPLKDIQGFLDSGFEFSTTGLSQQLGIFFSGNLWEDTHALTGEPIEWQHTLVHDIPTIGHPDDPDKYESAIKVRRALGHALDRELINDAIIDGRGYAVHHNYFNPNDPNWDERWEYEYDPNLAQQLLSESNFPDGFRTSLYVGPELGGGLGAAGEVGDAVAGFWDAIGVETEVLKYAYASFRPSVVGRTNTIPWITGCDEGRSTLPWDWPKGLVMTSMTRGGFGCGFESAWIAENFLNMVREPDRQARIEMANDFLDYIHETSLEVGVLAVPTGMVYNPRSIAAWPMRLSAGPQMNNVEEIVPAR